MAKQLPPLDNIMKNVPTGLDLIKLENRLKPNLGRYGSSEGFMGTDQRVADIITADYLTLLRLGLSYDQIANKLDQLMQGQGFIGDYKFGGEIICGEQECPWMDGKTDNQYFLWIVPSNGKPGFVPGEVHTPGTIEVSGLMPHLIRKHYFFEGNSRYRLNPEVLNKFIREEVRRF